MGSLLHNIRSHMGAASRRTLFLVIASVQTAAAFFVFVPKASAATVTLPDIQMKVPTSQISIGTLNGVRLLRYTHITWDAGTGPFEIDPTYNSTTGTATFVQSIYNSTSPGVWGLDHTVPVAATGVFDPPSDYQFPLNKFTLNSVNADGSTGAAVATSPKTDYCMTGDTYVGGVPNTPNNSFIPQSNCESPTKPLGWSVGWGDEYDQTDDGQPIDLTGVPDGTYILRGIADPTHVLTESNTSNNVTDTKIQIAGNSVTVLSQTNPGTTTPTVTMTSPATGSNVSGTVTLQADATTTAPATVSSVQFLLDGQPLGAPVAATPYSYNWTVGSTPLGSHTLSAQVTDTTGNMSTAAAITVNVVAGPSGSLTIDRTVVQTGTGPISTTPFSTSTANETLVALVSAGGPSGAGAQTSTVSGAGLAWTLVQRENTQSGDSEIWTANTSTTLSGATVTSTPSATGFDQQLTVLAFQGAAGVGTSAVAAAAANAPSVSLAATATGSYFYAVGNDYDHATARTLSTGQSLTSQWADSASSNTYWSQGTTTGSTAVGQNVSLSDTAPTTDQWNLAAVEIVPSNVTPPDATPPTVAITNPTNGQTVSGTTPLAANAADNVAVASVQFVLDGHNLGSPVTTAPYALNWDTTTVSGGSHTLSAIATDTSGNTGTATTVTVTVQNPAPPMTCFVMQAQVTAHGTGNVTTPSFHTAMAGEVLLAFVSADGPSGANKQTVTVSGAGLTWTLVKRANAQSGDSEIWTATAPNILTNATVKSTESKTGNAQDLTVIAMEGVRGIGASAATSATTGAPHVSLTTTDSTSLVFAVGNDWDRSVARTLPAGQVMLDQWVDTAIGDTYWSQYTNQPTGAAGSVVTMNDTAPTNDHWNMASVELLGDDE